MQDPEMAAGEAAGIDKFGLDRLRDRGQFRREESGQNPALRVMP